VTAIETDFTRATMAKVTRRLLPFLLLLYIVSWLDRANVSFAALQMNVDLGFSAAGTVGRRSYRDRARQSRRPHATCGGTSCRQSVSEPKTTARRRAADEPTAWRP
jgi:hypothetical protein